MGKTFLTASPPPRAHPTLSSLAPNSLDCVRSFVLPLLVRFRAWVIIMKKKRRRPHFPLSLLPSLASEIGSAVAWSQSQSTPKAAAAAASDENECRRSRRGRRRPPERSEEAAEERDRRAETALFFAVGRKRYVAFFLLFPHTRVSRRTLPRAAHRGPRPRP